MKSTLVILGLMILIIGCSSRNQLPVTSAPKQASAPEEDGGSVGNGGDDLPLDEGSAWFLGRRTVKYCYEASNDFGVGQETIESSLFSTIEGWALYLNERHDPDLQIEDPRLVFRTELLPRCDGSEDLTFYLGVRNRKVERQRRFYSHPLAFAYRESYDIRSGRGKGFVFVEAQGKISAGFPAWNQSSALKAILLHEIGHVLGCAHVSGTIMDAHIVSQMRTSMGPGSTEIARENFAHIDRLRKLLVPKGPLSFNLRREEHDGIRVLALPTSFLHPSMAAPLHLRSRAVVPNLVEQATAEFSVNGRQILIRGLREIGRARNDAPVFKMSFLREGVPTTVFSHTESITYQGLEGDEERQALLMYNGDNFQARILTWPVGGIPEVIAEF